MALLDPLPLRRQPDPYVCLIPAPPEVVMSHQPVEVDGAVSPDITLEVLDLGHGEQLRLEGPHNGIRCLERRPLGHVDDQLQLVLVVEGEHLHRNLTGNDQPP